MKSKTIHTRTSSRTAETGSAREHYHREKARRAKQAHPDSELMAAAKREYQALLEADAAKGKGGRPKKKASRPAGDDGEDFVDEGEAHAEDRESESGNDE